MGGSSDKIKVAIIDENQKQQDFQPLKDESILKVNYYKSLQQFLENQSLKKLSYIIIREKQYEQGRVLKDVNSITAKRMDNINQLNSQFCSEALKKNITVREKLIAYIRKFSLEKLVIYLLIKNAHNYKVPDYEAPYLTLIADSLQAIIDHVKTCPKREQPAIFKFKRLVKDLYRRTTVKIFEIKSTDEKQKKQSDESEAQWKQLMSKQKISVDFSYEITSFQQSLISNYSDYIIVSTPQMLTYILDAKKQFQFDSKIIYFGPAEQVQQKKSAIWMISNGRTSPYKTIVTETIKKCSDLITDKSSVRPKLTIIFTTNHYTREEKDYIKDKAIQGLKKSTKQQDKKWIQQMKVVVTSNYQRLKDQVKHYVYTYLITFDCTIIQSEDLKAWLKKNGLGNRIYLYNLQLKDSKKGATTSQDNDARIKKITKDVETMVLKAGFKIKFQIGPLESIALFQMSDKQYRHFSSKIGLMGTKIDEQTFASQYCKKNREKIIDNYYIVCNVDGYFNKLKKLITQQFEQSNSYFKDLRILIYDKKQFLQPRWDDLRKDNSIAFVHYNFTKIQDFLDLVFVPSLKASIFVKKSLPQYIQSLKNLEESRSRNLNLKGMIVSKNNLLKQVFQEQIITGTQFDLNFRHYSITNRNLQESIQSLYKFVDRFANLWRVGYDIIKANQDKTQVIDTLRSDLKSCLYKCKAYSLLDVSDEEFDYFYIKRLDICQTFLDLQIAVIYITTLPHGFNKILEQIFSRPKQNGMIPKVFSAFIVILLTAFCSVEDEVMSNKSLVVYIDDNEMFSKMGSLNIGDIFFNTNFIPSGKNESAAQNDLNHCLFIQFEDIPMLSESFIKNYLYIQRFSFYKESSQYLIAPYTQFVLKNKLFTANGKYHLYLQAINEQQKGFPQSVLKYNSIDDKQLFNTIKQQINLVNDDVSLSKMTQDVKSLYKKSQIISLYEQKREMVKSINDSLQYKNFMNALNKDKYLSALNHLNYKLKSQKMTTQIQAQYFKAMLGVQRSLLYYKMNEFDQGIKELDKVQKFLENQEQNWVKRTIRKFKESMNDASTKRHKLFNRAPKVKKWKIYADRQANNPQKTSFLPVVVMKQESYSWSVNYLPNRQEHYMANSKDPKIALLSYKLKQNFGEHVGSFTNDMVYERTNAEKLAEQQKDIKGYFKFKVDHNFKQNYLSTKELHVKQRSNNYQKTRKQDTSKNQSFQQDNYKSKDGSKTVKELAKESPKFIEIKTNQQEKLPNIFEPLEKQQFFQPPQQIKSMNKLIPIKDYTNFEKLLGVTETVAWQSFYYGDRFVLTKKGKHFKGKMPNKIQ